MSVGQRERKTQERVVEFFTDVLGYDYLGNWEERADNSNVEEGLLEKYLRGKYSDILIQKAVHELQKAAMNQSKSLYDVNKDVYSLLRYGVQVKEGVGENKETIWLIDWAHPRKNHFAVAEEVTIKGQHDKRPDLVLYVNGIALGVVELKRSTIAVSEGIRQNLDNQKNLFIKSFFHTIQLVMAGNDSEGLRYGTILTPEKYYLTWKEEVEQRHRLDKHLYGLCNKERILELIHDFIVFDLGTKKICRHNQYVGVKNAQQYLKKREGGIIWHTQGSGKSLTMIWLAKWIREHFDDSRVLIITDREELDGQIEGFFQGVGEKIHRTTSCKNLIKCLNEHTPWLMCSLIHKFGRKDDNGYDNYINELLTSLPSNFKAKGDVYVFVDECHRTQSGKLHEAMKGLLPGAVFIGFTGTPLLKQDKKRSLEVFGRYLHTYKYDEAVTDKVVLDLQYEAREIDQKLTSQDRVDQWFEAKTKGLTPYAKAELKKKWGTMQKVLSSQSRLNKIVGDILLDMEVRPRLLSGRGNAILVAGNIYQACKYYELFQQHGLKKCAIVTSYEGDITSIKGESVSEDEETDNTYKHTVYQGMLCHYEELYPEMKTKGFEVVIKEKFVKEPGQMKLLIVVDKLLTGFDAPPATYLYIDKSMQDHGLFQAICRVNRLDGEDKEYGYIVDYKDLFKSLGKAVKDYTSDAFDNFEQEDVNGLLNDRLATAKENLDTSLENLKAICEPVAPPKETIDYIQYFCGDTEKPEDLNNTAPRRVILYKLSAAVVRAYANIANDMTEAGYTHQQAEKIKEAVQYYDNVRTEIKLASGDYIDLKAYEPAMRHLIDAYIDAEESKKVSAFDDVSLIDLIVKSGADALDSLPKSIKKNKDAVAEAIENNVRKRIVQEKPANPKYFDRMSLLLEELIRSRKEEGISYATYLKKIEELIKNVVRPLSTGGYPRGINSNTKRALYDNLDNNEELALKVDEAINNNKPDGWRGNKIKEKTIRIAIRKTLEACGIENEDQVDLVLNLARNQHDY